MCLDLALQAVIGHGAGGEAGLAVLQALEGDLGDLAFEQAKLLELGLGGFGGVFRRAGGGQGGGFLVGDELADAFGLCGAGVLAGQAAFDGGIERGGLGFDKALFDEVGEVGGGFEGGFGAGLLGHQFAEGGRKLGHVDLAPAQGKRQQAGLLGKVGTETAGLADQVAIELEAGGGHFGGVGQGLGGSGSSGSAGGLLGGQLGQVWRAGAGAVCVGVVDV